MKKFLFILLSLGHVPDLHAHGQLGIQMMPGATFSKISVAPFSDSYGVSSGPWSGHFQGGVVYDYSFDYSFWKENYYASTGIFYVEQQLSLQRDGNQERYELRYFQVPCLLKLYTNEVELDLRIYGKIGLAFQFNLSRLLDEQHPSLLIEKFKYLEAKGVLGGGAEYEIGPSTSLFLGLSFHGGLSNIVHRCNLQEKDKQVRGYTTLWSVDFGAKF